MKERKTIYNLALTGILATLITLFTAYFVHIPVGANGGYVHFGDTVIYIAAAILPAPYALAAGAIGGGMADLLTAPAWTLATVIIKMLIVLPFTSAHSRILCKRNLAAPFISFLISGIGYYIAEAILFGTAAAFFVSLSGSVVQSLGSAVFFFLLGGALDRIKIKNLLYSDKETVRNQTNKLAKEER